MKLGDKSVGSNAYDLLLLVFPIWIPLFFFFGFSLMTTAPAILFFLALFFLGETHFGATWLFFMDSSNRNWVSSKPYIFYVFPVLIIAATVAVFFLISASAAIMLNAAASAFHVTRQSIGVNKMFGVFNHRGVKRSTFFIYLISALFIFLGYLRFFAGINIPQNTLWYFQLIGLAAIAVIFAYLLASKVSRDLSIKFHLAALTGMLVYFPYTFVPRPEYAVAMGVGMHWLQYLAITVPLYSRKSKVLLKENRRNLMTAISRNRVVLFSYLLAYASIMLVLRQWGVGFETFSYSALILVPLCLQMLHFYYDGFIWRFSDPHIRKEVGSYLFSSLPKIPAGPK